jgi:hypothetical protein
MMASPMTGGVDHDFAAMMIPHHQGAIDMAKPFLLYGKLRGGARARNLPEVPLWRDEAKLAARM